MESTIYINDISAAFHRVACKKQQSWKGKTVQIHSMTSEPVNHILTNEGLHYVGGRSKNFICI